MFLAWNKIFSSGGKYYIRKSKAIRTVVEQHDRLALRYRPNLIQVLKSLLEDGVFGNNYRARDFFPEIFIQKPIEQTKAASSPPRPLFGMEGPSKELLDSFKK